MRAIFISYRREDTEGHAGRLFRDLSERFGKDMVFMDVAGVEAGRDFRRVIEQQVASCGVLLAIIGKNWLTVTDEEGRRRLDDPMDFVRFETANALKRDIPVVPVLVHGARIPRPEQLPDDLKDLAYRNSVELTHERWQSDVQVLIKALMPYVDSTPEGVSSRPRVPIELPKGRWRSALLASALLIALGAGGYLMFEKSDKPAVVEVQGDKSGRDRPGSDATSPSAQTQKAETSTVDPIPDISGVWHDSDQPNNGSRITQNGTSFRFTRWGILPNGIRFSSSGSGTLTGRRYTSTHSAKYQSGQSSEGYCSGTVSPDGLRIDLNCRDSLIGTFDVTGIRQ
jgi:hypothetical protein